jgi:hypothetical protein
MDANKDFDLVLLPRAGHELDSYAIGASGTISSNTWPESSRPRHRHRHGSKS